MNIFTKKCTNCGDLVFGPREGGKARGRWLGYDECPICRKDKPAATLLAAIKGDVK